MYNSSLGKNTQCSFSCQHLCLEHFLRIVASFEFSRLSFWSKPGSPPSVPSVQPRRLLHAQVPVDFEGWNASIGVNRQLASTDRPRTREGRLCDVFSCCGHLFRAALQFRLLDRPLPGLPAKVLILARLIRIGHGFVFVRDEISLVRLCRAWHWASLQRAAGVVTQQWLDVPWPLPLQLCESGMSCFARTHVVARWQVRGGVHTRDEEIAKFLQHGLRALRLCVRERSHCRSDQCFEKPHLFQLLRHRLEAE